MCHAELHNTVRAYRDAGCRCPTIVDRMRRYWRAEDARRVARRTDLVIADLIDEVAIERAMSGDRVGLTPPERGIAITRLTDLGMSARQIAMRLHVAPRTVTRYRSGRVKSAR